MCPLDATRLTRTVWRGVTPHSIAVHVLLTLCHRGIKSSSSGVDRAGVEATSLHQLELCSKSKTEQSVPAGLRCDVVG